MEDGTIFTSRWHGGVIVVQTDDNPAPFLIGTPRVNSGLLRTWRIACRFCVDGLLRLPGAAWPEGFRWGVGFTDDPEHEAFFRHEAGLHVYYLNSEHHRGLTNKRLLRRILMLAMHEVAHSVWTEHDTRFIYGRDELQAEVDDDGYRAAVHRRIGNTHIRILRLFVQHGRLSLRSAEVEQAGLVQTVTNGTITTFGKWSPRVGELKREGYLRTIGGTMYRGRTEALEITDAGREFLAQIETAS